MEHQTELKIIRLKEVVALTGLSKATIYRYIKKGIFPKSKELGIRAVGWSLSDITEWLECLSSK
ncbi:helix-turn-helix transcriptional regulator [Psychromonas algicola]|uniref:helix-turn-helix transcriptional regulator n=1 Tax=Psychromonas algicola TaxID=2555642 RepID=UPI00106849CD|nr:AlpA family transcriptional regulator [Psychromonas sp. RZ5]TEW45322.1 AlpA family transcriptional regulator [Psychromonas sp. RZ5]